MRNVSVGETMVKIPCAHVSTIGFAEISHAALVSFTKVLNTLQVSTDTTPKSRVSGTICAVGGIAHPFTYLNTEPAFDVKETRARKQPVSTGQKLTHLRVLARRPRRSVSFGASGLNCFA